MTDQPLWTPSPERAAGTRLAAFMRIVGREHGVDLPDYAALHAWSVAEKAAFWSAVWQFCGVIGERGARGLVHPERMPGARFFPDARLNYARNLLRRRDDSPALLFRGETGLERQVSHAGLYDAVARLAAALLAAGVQPGDRVAGLLPNGPEAVIGLLAAAAIGAVWSSASPDFGVQGVLDRFGQIQPKVLLGIDRYWYGGKEFDCTAKLAAIREGLPGLRAAVLVPYDPERPTAPMPGWVPWADFTAAPAAEIPFADLPFDHPLAILYSSGTTGVPKCIVHGAGGTLLQHLKEHVLHSDTRAGDRVFFFTTCGWMMWNWLVSALAAEATLVLYDGSPVHPGPAALFDLADRTAMTLFGSSAKFFDAVAKSGLRPIASHSLASVRTIASTGSPLAPEAFDFVYRDVKAEVQLSSISGGTDIVSCFALGNPIGPVWRGEIQVRGLGMPVEVFDEAGQPVRGEKGELVCTGPFPSMPLGFWNDPDGRRYHEAYFARYPGVWHHGDYVMLTAHDGLVIYGRSDATLNPGGVRIGTAEITRIVEQVPEVAESLVIGQDWQGDVRVVLFVRLRAGHRLDEALESRIRQRLRREASPRHVPARIVAVADLPRTRSGKLVELAVRAVIHDQPVRNREALANPDALALFQNLPELRE